MREGSIRRLGEEGGGLKEPWVIDTKIVDGREFVMLDKNHHGVVDLDEAVSILYARFGKEGVDERVQEIVAPDDNEKTIKYAQFIDIAKHAAKAKYGTILKPGATMVPHVRSVATDGF